MPTDKQEAKLCTICNGYGRYQDGDSGTESDGYAPNIVECDCAPEERHPAAPSVEQDEREAFERALASTDAYDPQSFIDGAKWQEARAASTSANVAQGAGLTDEQISRKGDLYGSYSAAEGYWSFSPKEFIDCVRALLSDQVANVARGAEAVYQVRNNVRTWIDVDAEDYERCLNNDRRIVYTAPPAQTALAGRLASAAELFKRLKRDLMHARRFGADTLANYRRACSNAEGEVEEWLIENAKAPESGSNSTDPKEPT
jgi:hypothetical protein